MYAIPRRFAGIKRFERILQVLSRHGLDYILEKAELKKDTVFSSKKILRPVELKMLFEELGGCFIRLGKFLSLRPDLIPKQYSDALIKLHDSSEAMPYGELEHVIRSELKRPLGELFSSFDKAPFVSTSIGELHAATLKGRKEVVVKVMRPGIRAMYEQDLEIMDYLSRQLKHKARCCPFDAEDLFFEFKKVVEQELDYLNEATNIKSLAAASRKDEDRIVPRVNDSLTTKRVLVAGLIRGTALRRIITEPGRFRQSQKKKVAKIIFLGFMRQVFSDGLFQADMDHGSMIITDDSKVCFSGFGIPARVDDGMKEKFSCLLRGLSGHDVGAVIRCLISLDRDSSSVNLKELKREVSFALLDRKGVPFDEATVASRLLDCIEVARDNKMLLPSQLAYFARAFSDIANACIHLDPDFNVAKELKSFIDDSHSIGQSPVHSLSKLKNKPERFFEMHSLLGERVLGRKKLRIVAKSDVALESVNSELSELTREIRREGQRMVIGILIVALLVASSLINSMDSELAGYFVGAAVVLFIYLVFSLVKDHVRRALV